MRPGAASALALLLFMTSGSVQSALAQSTSPEESLLERVKNGPIAIHTGVVQNATVRGR